MEQALHRMQVFVGVLMAVLLFSPTFALAHGLAKAELELEGEVNGEARSGGSGVSGNAGVNVGVGVGVDNWGVRSDDDADGTADTSESDSDDAEFKIDHDAAVNASSTIEVPERVTTRGELRSFLNHLVKADDRVAEVRVSSTTVETRYQIPAKFLWAIPASITANVVIGSDGSVTITYPWYAFLFATAKPKAELEAQVEEHASSTVGASATTTLSASAQARLLNSIFAALKSSVEVRTGK